jgi:putative lipase involved disintegration of autophagic bodies
MRVRSRYDTCRLLFSSCRARHSEITSAVTRRMPKSTVTSRSQLAERFREDRTAYNTAKGEFVAELTNWAIRYSEKVIR